MVNLRLTTLQVSVGLLAGSQGQVADGIHSLSGLVDRAVDEAEAEAIRRTLVEIPGVQAVHDIAVEARQRVPQRHRVLKLMTHVDPWRRPDADREAPSLALRRQPDAA